MTPACVSELIQDEVPYIVFWEKKFERAKSKIPALRAEWASSRSWHTKAKITHVEMKVNRGY